MALLLFTLLLSLSVSVLTSSCFNNEDVELVSSMLQYLNTKQYILVSEFCSESLLARELKFFSNRNISGIYLKIENLMNYLENNKIPDVRTMVVLKAGNNIVLKKMMEALRAKICDRKMFEIFSWMMLLSKNPIKFNENNFHVPFDCRFFISQESGIMEIYQIKNKSSMIYHYFGKYTDEGLQTNRSYFLYEKRMNMNGESLIMKVNDKVLCRWLPECLHLEIWDDMGKILNFTTHYVKKSELEKNTSKLPDVTSDQIFLHYTTKNKDHVLGPLLMQVAHLYVKEISDEKRWDSYIRPFDRKLWAAVLLWILISGTAIFIVTWASLTILSLRGFTILDQVFIPLSAFTNQGCGYLPKTTSSRISKLSAYVASAIMVPAYSAALISYLTVHHPKIPFTDLESLTEATSYKLAPFYSPFLVHYFTQTNDPVTIKIRQQQLVPVEEFPRTHVDAIELICKEDNVAVFNANYRMTQYPSPCSILRVSDKIFEIPGGIELLNEGLHHRKLLSKMVIRFHSSGIMQKLRNINFGETRVEKIQEFDAIGLNEVKSIMVFALLSILICILLFVVEWLHYYNKDSLKSKFFGKSEPSISLFIRDYDSERPEANLRLAPHLRRFSLFRMY